MPISDEDQEGIAMMPGFAAATVEPATAAPITGRPAAADWHRSPVHSTAARSAVQRIIAMTAVALALCSALTRAQAVPTPAPRLATPQQQTAAPDSAPAAVGLSDLNAVTFSCPRAGLNAAAREAAKVRSQGTYQFAYFKIINDTHHAEYEVHFKSNYDGEADLQYCVSIYCQQGWDASTTKATVTLMSKERQRMGAAHGASCAAPSPARRRSTR
jgi:hypothetical protein